MEEDSGGTKLSLALARASHATYAPYTCTTLACPFLTLYRADDVTAAFAQTPVAHAPA